MGERVGSDGDQRSNDAAAREREFCDDDGYDEQGRLAQARTRMEKAVEDFRKDLSGVRTGRANVSLLDHIRVDYHGTPMPVNQLGTLTVPEPA